MRALPVRRIATSVLCVSLLIGTAGPVVAAESDTSRGDTGEATRAPDPGADELLAQVNSIGESGVLAPVTDLLSAVLKVEKGELPAEDAMKLADPAKDAIAEAATQMPANSTAPKTPAAPEAKTLEDPDNDVEGLQTSVDDLLKSAEGGGEQDSLLGAVKPVLGSLLGVVTGLLGGAAPAAQPAAGSPAQQTPALT
ncbi:hypothetical protein GCM10010277_35550 [Streptomyces longisporoflavus]|uniref:hypothetical protein n=1 Tax=Streptomyces longisporoflavus TaxID=28044 RepID=UPI00167DDD70|nr:hypothetical protein [Streptomyces longisporoflavus]GGV44828.1 hypothetical protein GCM10010277_35550 [Streptomyces longisporoflavus]